MIEKNTYEVLRDLMLIPGLSGFEDKVAKYLKETYQELGLEPEIDIFGNVITKIEGTNPEAPVVMVFAHMDTMGFMVKTIEENGLMHIERVGGISEKTLSAAAVQIQTRNGDMVDGYFMVRGHHTTPPEEKYVVDKYPTLLLDIGVESAEEVKALGIEIGSPVVHKPNCVKLQGTRLYGTALDNRKGCTTLVKVAEYLQDKKLEPTVYLVHTVQEEYSIRGAIIAARKIKPQMAICVDGGGGEVGKGVGVSRYNFHGRGTLNGTIPHPEMVRRVEAAAERAGIPLQWTAALGALTDMAYVQYEGDGVAGIDLGAPGKGAHHQAETCDWTDIDKTAELIVAVLEDIKGHVDLRRG